jgi:hypothetical protein
MAFALGVGFRGELGYVPSLRDSRRVRANPALTCRATGCPVPAGLVRWVSPQMILAGIPRSQKQDLVGFAHRFQPTYPGFPLGVAGVEQGRG